LVDQVRSGQRLVQFKDIEVLNPSICSEKTIGILQDLLERVVISGTATNIYSDKYSCAGKTGTAQIAEGGSYGTEYRSSFAGYFPSENPKFSCIVVVTKPKKEIGFYGNIVAAPVFKELRDALFAEEAIEVPVLIQDVIHEYVGKYEEINALHQVFNKPLNPIKSKSLIYFQDNQFKALHLEDQSMPNVKGMSAMDALYILENLGLIVQIEGKGLVKSQSIKPGLEIIENQKVSLDMTS
jgi:cell division protein FtsI (penicillin-binding protein 3)